MSVEVATKPAMSDQPIVSRNPVRGAITGLYADVLQGWALDSLQLEQRLVIEIMIDGAPVALVRADQFYPHAVMGDDFHGFTVQLRQPLLTDARHISARVANQPHRLEGEIWLPSTPRVEPAPVASQVWHNGGLRLSGWAWDSDAPHRHVQMTVREDDRVWVQASCDEHHQALVYRGTSDHGFTIDLPWELADGKLHVLHVENDLGHTLSGSPIHLCCWPQGLEGLLKQQTEHGPDEATSALLAEVAKHQTMRFPKSAGFNHYPQWHKAFQLQASAQDKESGRIGVLLIGDGDSALEQASLASLKGDAYPDWKEAIAPDSNVLAGVRQLLDAGCEAIVPLNAGDHLAQHALCHLADLVKRKSNEIAWAYADCDRDGPSGERSLPWLKPVWDIDLFIGSDIFTSGAIFSADIIESAVSLLAHLATQKHVSRDLLFAAIALATERRQGNVLHLPHVLYHRHHQSPASPELFPPSKDRVQAVAWLCEQLTPHARVEPLPQFPALLRARWPLPAVLPRVSLVVPTRDQVGLLRTCVEGLLHHTDYPDLEIIVVDNQSSDPATLEYLKRLPSQGVKVLPHPYPFNYSTINNRAIEHATGEIIGLVNNDIEIIEPDWLKEMVSQLLRDHVGAVGAKLLWPNRMVQHGGVVVGINGLAAHTGNHLNEDDAGYLANNQLTRRQSAVTAACLLLRKSLFDELGGLDEKTFPVAFNDVDLCLRIQQSGLNIIWTAFAKLIHAESASRGKDISPDKHARAQREQQGFIERWSLDGKTDPHYHPALSHDYLTGPYGGLAFPPPCSGSRSNQAGVISHTGSVATDLHDIER